MNYRLRTNRSGRAVNISLSYSNSEIRSLVEVNEPRSVFLRWAASCAASSSDHKCALAPRTSACFASSKNVQLSSHRANVIQGGAGCAVRGVGALHSRLYQKLAKFGRVL